VHLDPLDSSFRAYQQQRDPAALAAVFDAAAPRLLLVAMHLVRDAATAEDLVQTVFLQVLRDAGSCQPGRPVLPWLLGMLEHRAIDARRRAHVRREQGGAEAFGAARGVAAVAATPPDLAADAECRQQVSEALAGMPREYREVLTLRLVHGLAAVDIAHSLGLAPATVRMRASRGLKLLRSALPRGLATPALLAWLGAESLRANDGLQAVRAKVLAAAGGGVAATLSGLWLFGIAVLLLLAVGAGLWRGGGAPPFAPIAAPAPTVVAAEQGASRDAEHGRDATAQDLVANGRSAANDPRRTSLRGTVVAAETGLPLAGVEVRLQLQPKAGRLLAAAHDVPATSGTAIDGGFECAFVPPPDCFVTLELVAPGRVPESRSFDSLRQGVVADLGAIPLAAGTPVVLQLRRAGRPLAGVDVDLRLRREDQSSSWLGIEPTDAAGRVDLGTIAAGAYEHDVRVPLPGRAGRFLVPLQASPLEVAIELGEPDRAGSITGVAVRPDGLPFAGVELGVPSGGRYGGYYTCKTDLEGRFVFVRSELSPPRVPITLWSSQPELELFGEGTEIAWGSHDVRLLVQTRATATLRVRCVDAETGAPVPTFGATCWLDPWEAGTGGGPRLAAAPRVQHPDGVCTLTNLLPGASFLSVFPPAPYAEHCERSVSIRPGQQELQVALRRPLACRVQAIDVGGGAGVAGVEIALARVLPLRDHADVELTTYRVDLTGGREDLSYSTGTNVLVVARGRTDGDGVVQLSVPPDLPGLVLLAEGPHCIGAIRHDVSVVEDGATLTIEVARAASLHGKVTPIDLVTRFGPAAEELAALAERARVQHVDETELAKDYPSLLLRRVDAEQRELAALLGSDGSFRLGGVPPGRYEAWLAVATRCNGSSYGTRLGPLATLTVAVEPQPAALHLDGSRWLPGRLDLRLLVDGAPFQGTVSVRSERLHLRYTAAAAGRVRSDWLPPDTYFVGIEVPGAFPHGSIDPRPLVVAAGGQLEGVASVVRRPVRITLQAPASGAPVADAWLLLRALDHPLLHDDLVVARTGTDGVAEFRAAPPGRLQVAMLTAAQIDAQQLEAAIPLGLLSSSDTALQCTLLR
jgi:RNA polymerase sigma-70 factor (ECF subfamily)